MWLGIRSARWWWIKIPVLDGKVQEPEGFFGAMNRWAREKIMKFCWRFGTLMSSSPESNYYFVNFTFISGKSWSKIHWKIISIFYNILPIKYAYLCQKFGCFLLFCQKFCVFAKNLGVFKLFFKNWVFLSIFAKNCVFLPKFGCF